MDLFLHFLFCSINLFVYIFGSITLSWSLEICRHSYNQIMQICSFQNYFLYSISLVFHIFFRISFLISTLKCLLKFGWDYLVSIDNLGELIFCLFFIIQSISTYLSINFGLYLTSLAKGLMIFNLKIFHIFWENSQYIFQVIWYYFK